ncbi:GH92 family glycosyl hydrolase [Endozoicomonas sp. 4G]|uniref:GH92 family glycosyl hydrolase n=1 Tax=Endozoicomonas sp. 4G TaxID=2872754 RepID=UPI002078FAB0|nr:GH92 family glycosyl hydrolase [Endozoicomonas sp. 4G]
MLRKALLRKSLLRKSLLAVSIAAVLGTLAGCDSSDDESTVINAPPETSLTQYVDTTIGTGGLGNTYPGATVPHGMIQLSPDNGVSGWDYISGYFYYDDLQQMIGFSHTHLSGTGAGDMYDLRVMPVNSRSDLLRGNKEASEFDHENETATAGYYQVMLKDYEINAELTSTERVGFHRYTFPTDDRSEIVIDPGHTMNWDLPTETMIRVVDHQTLEGYRMSEGWAADQREYFVIKFSKPFKAHRLFAYSYGEDGTEIPGNQVKKDYTRAYLEFETTAAKTEIEVKVAMSSVSIDGAYKNLAAEAQDLDFEGAHKRATVLWEKELEKVEIPTEDERFNDEKRIFYTAIYHSLLGPTLHSDIDGQYKGADHQTQKAEEFDRYDTFSLWDTYRAAHPLYTILEPERVDDMVKSMLAHYDETGLLPVWSLKGNETNMMQGYHALPVIADAIIKDIGDFDRERAYQAMADTARNESIPGMTQYINDGYVHYGITKGESDTDDWAASKTLEYAYDDWSVAVIAKRLGKDESEVDEFFNRADNWKNQFDDNVVVQHKDEHGNLIDIPGGWFVPKLADGSFIPDFNPEQYHRDDSDQDSGSIGFSESNGWHYFASVPHNIDGLINKLGGPDVMEKRLDLMFGTEPKNKDHLPIFSTGMVGQYVQGNEPDMHVPYLFNYVQSPWKTQKWLNEVINVCYDDTPEGICGNDDYGQTSAWYVFSAMGFYPVNPANSVYAIGKPIFPELTLNLPDNKSFTVIAENVSDENIYIQSATLNGEVLDRSWISHEEIMNGGELKFVMYNEPNKNWASAPDSVPPSGLSES